MHLATVARPQGTQAAEARVVAGIQLAARQDMSDARTRTPAPDSLIDMLAYVLFAGLVILAVGHL
ncbi:MAG: hypothetical protein ACTHU0_34260 [Kofleriaceae bacterium]